MSLSNKDEANTEYFDRLAQLAPTVIAIFFNQLFEPDELALNVGMEISGCIWAPFPC